MNEMMFTVGFNVVGALSANYVWYWTLPVGATLYHVSAVGSNANDATIMIGDSGDTDQALTATAVGDSGTPATVAFASLDGVDRHFSAGDVLVVTIDYDGSSGTAVQNLQVVLTFLAG